MTRTEERYKFVSILADEFEDYEKRQEIRNLAPSLMRNAKAYATIQERWCSEEMSEATTTRLEKREANIEKWFTTTLQPFGITPDFQGDPRGAVVKLKVPSGRTDDWGKTGICVPEGN
jgi:hypothetical protein